MGDAPPPSSSAGEHANLEAHNRSFSRGGTNEAPQFPQGSSPGASNSPYMMQYPQQYVQSQGNFPGQFDMAHAQGLGRSNPYNMTSMANALPQGGFRPNYNVGQQQQRPGVAQGAQAHQMAQVSQYGGQPGINPLAAQQYYLPQQHAQMQAYYGAQMSPTQQQHPNLNQRPNLGYYPNHPMLNQTQQSMAPGYYYTAQNSYVPQNPGLHGQVPPGQYPSTGVSGEVQDASNPQGNEQLGQSGSVPGVPEGSIEPRSNTVRGPPRKPRQSGHAIWIGNLPPQTDLMTLVHHVCKEAEGLESLFLISKSNCAFANFKDEQTCTAAQQKLHDSKFQSVRLVSRLRKNAVEGSTGQIAPTGPAAAANSTGTQLAAAGDPAPEKPTEEIEIATSPEKAVAELTSAEIPSATAPAVNGPQQDKFFILKSLTVEDLELSVRNGVWATQSHNEEALNKAFQAVENVYLIFSANKSGEYFGYAKMTSPINDDPAAAIQFAPTAQATSDADAPKAIPTEATDTCPKGRIIDDSARGTIFWEIEREDDDRADHEIEDEVDTEEGQDDEANSKAWGKPFKLEWLSTARLPFYRTRGLRNPWNSNREVKIARDGTELETTVGRRLIGLFNRVQSPAPVAMGLRPGIPMVAGYPPPMRAQYPQ